MTAQATKKPKLSAPERLRSLDHAALAKLGPKERKLAEDALRQIAVVAERNPLAAFVPYDKQIPFLDSVAKSKLFIAGNQTGKTTIGLADDLIQACDREAIPSHLLPYKKHEPPFFARLMTPDFDHTMDQVLLPKLRDLTPKDQLAGGLWSKAYDKRHRVLRFKNGSWFQFNSYKQEVSDLQGATLHRVHYDESPPKAHRSESKIRLVRYGGQEIFTLTPVDGIEHWIFDEFWTEHERGMLDPKFAQVFTATMDDNPYLSADERDWVLHGLSEEEKDARRRGIFRALHGLIYADFNPRMHVVPTTKLPENVNVIVGIDPGARYAAAVVWVAIDARGLWRVFEELKMPGLNVEDTADRIHRLNAKWEVDPMLYVIDPSARNTLHHTGRSDQDLYKDYGIVTMAGQNDVAAGIKKVRGMLTIDDGEPRMVINDICEELIAEFKKYRWKEPPASGEETREQPMKKDDHLLDALRYVVMARPYAPDVDEEDTRTPQERMAQDDIDRAWGAERDGAGEFGYV